MRSASLRAVRAGLRRTALLLIDELGFEPMTRPEASLFFRLVTYRYGRGAILITTNKSVRDWTELLAGGFRTLNRTVARRSSFSLAVQFLERCQADCARTASSKTGFYRARAPCAPGDTGNPGRGLSQDCALPADVFRPRPRPR